jgi:PAS domain S-box-containing protein
MEPLKTTEAIEAANPFAGSQPPPEVAAFDELPTGVVLSEVAQPTRFVYVNSEFCRLTGYARAELLHNPGVNTLLGMAKPEAQPQPKAAAYDLLLRHQSGQPVYVSLKSGYYLVAGQRYLVIYYTDVTDRVRAVRHLAQCEQVLRETQAVAKVGSIDLDFANGRLVWSDETFRIFGLPPNSKIPSSKLFFECIHPDDAAWVFRRLDLAIASQADLDLEYRIVQVVSQQVRRIRINARHLPASQGSSQRFVGTVRQIEGEEGNFATETELRRAQQLLNGAREAIVTVNAFSTEITRWNKAAEELYGWPADQAVGRRYNELLATQYGGGQSFDRFIEQLMARQHWVGELRQKHRDGHLVVIEAGFEVVSDSASVVPELFIFSTAKTDTSRSEQYADELAHTLNLLLGNIPGWVVLVDLKLEIFGCNDNFARAMGQEDKAFFTGKPLASLPISPGQLPKLVAQARHVIDTGQPFLRQDEAIQTASGETFFLETNKLPLLAERGGAIQGVLISADDVTEKRRAEAQLRQNEREQERMRSLAIIQGQEEERKRVSMELHDGVGQLLTAMQMKVDFLKNGEDSQDAARGQEFAEAVNMVHHARQEVRRISYNLMPSVLSDFGLEEALGNLCKVIENNSEVVVDAFIDTGGRRFAEPVEIAIFRIAQEALNNALKYSQATSLMLELSALDNQLQLIVEDNGRGFDPQKTNRGQGLANLAQRARLLNGHLEIGTAPGQGTRVRAVLPVL